MYVRRLASISTLVQHFLVLKIVSQFSCNINALLGREEEEIEKNLNLRTVMIHQQKLTDQGQFLFLLLLQNKHKLLL